MIMSTRVNNTKVIISARASYLHALSRIPSMDLIRNIPLV